jgi:predicted DNA repair protein MutK
MASGFFALFDDIALLMDDMATMSQVATKKTAGILGDDLAVAAEQASGSAASRELHVIWAIFKGSAINKAIILPLAFLLSAFAPWIIVPILMLGGVYLAYEGMEKIVEYFFHKKTQHEKISAQTTQSKEEVLSAEKDKIKSAIRTDFILSVEIVILALSTVSQSSLMVQIAVVTLVAILATVGVYGLVALLVRMDDFGYKLVSMSNDTTSTMHKFGQFLIRALPKVIRALAVIGTIAMFLVAGGIFVHNVPAIHDIVHSLPSILGELLVGAIVGILAVAPMEIAKKIKTS